MNKRGQIYILAAVLLCIAIYGVMKVTNRIEVPSETNFDFYVENFQGERSYVVDYGFLAGDEESTGRVTSGNGLLDIFTSFGSGTGIVFAEYKGSAWTVTNYLGQNIQIEECEGCEEISIPSGDLQVAQLSFNIGKKYYVKGEEEELAGLGLPEKYFTKTFSINPINIKISGNDYIFNSEDKEIESIIFQNIDKNYVRVVKV